MGEFKKMITSPGFVLLIIFAFIICFIAIQNNEQEAKQDQQQEKTTIQK